MTLYILQVNDKFYKPFIHVYLNLWHPCQAFIYLKTEKGIPLWIDRASLQLYRIPFILGHELSYVVDLLAGYFLHLGMLNQLITLSHQLNSDAFNLTNHKYMAHQTALLYVRSLPLYLYLYPFPYQDFLATVVEEWKFYKFFCIDFRTLKCT